MMKKYKKELWQILVIVFILFFLVGSALYWVNIIKEDSILHNQDILLLGNDSVVCQQWKNEIEKETGGRCDNRAITGSNAAEIRIQQLSDVADKYALNNILKWQDLNKYEYCMLAYGTGDFYASTKLGDINSNDSTTFYGGVKTAIGKIKSENPSLKLIIVIPMRIENEYTINEKGCRLDEYRNALREIAYYNGIPVIKSDEVQLDAKHFNEEDNDSNDQMIAKYITNQLVEMPKVETYDKIQDIIPDSTGENMIKTTDFDTYNTSRIYFKDSENAKGTVFDLTGGVTATSSKKYMIEKKKSYYVTFSAFSETNTVVQVDFFSGDEIITYKLIDIPPGEHKNIKITINVPEELSEKDAMCYFRIGNTNVETNTLQISSLTLCEDRYHIWSE